MRSSKLAALVAILAGGVWIGAGVLSWEASGLDDRSTQLWWGGLGGFALASALVGYASVTRSPIWLRAVVFLGAGVLGASVPSLFDTDLEDAPLIVAVAGGLLLLLGLVGLVRVLRRGRRSRRNGNGERQPQRGGHRASR